MTSRASETSHTAPSSRSCENGDFAGVGVAYYLTDHELNFYLRALQRVQGGRLVVVLVLRECGHVVPFDLPAHARIILAAAGSDIDPDEVVDGVALDPLNAVVVAMAGLQPQDGLLLLLPADWRGEAPDALVEEARRRCAALVRPAVESGDG